MSGEVPPNPIPQPASNPYFNNPGSTNEPPPPYPGGSTGAAPLPPINSNYNNDTTKYPLPNQGAPPPQQPYPAYGPPGPYQPPAGGAGYQPVPGQPPAPGQPTTTTVIIAQNPGRMGPYPVNMTCPKCSAQIVTSVESIAGVLTWILAGVICFFGCWFGCCLIPFCVNEAQDAVHRCPNCKQYIGTYRRL